MTDRTQVTAVEPARPRPIGLDQATAADKGAFSSCSEPSTLNHSARRSPMKAEQPATGCKVALLTGGGDKPYALGLATALTSEGILVDLIGSDELDVQDLRELPGLHFLNLRQDQRPEASLMRKALRILRYYLRLIHYAATAQPKVFHILWNNKFELFDRTILLLYYKMCRRRIVFTAHNVNAAKRNHNDSWLNRISLKVQYRLVDHIFVHTEKMKSELVSDFGVSESKASVIPFGINNTLPNTELTAGEAKKQLGIEACGKTVLFFGQIAAYKGLEYLVEAFEEFAGKSEDYHLVIAGKPKRGYEGYWEKIRARIECGGRAEQVIQRIEHIPDEKVELYFKAADALILPYSGIFQSGVLFLAYSFGLPVIAADVGTLKEEIIEGESGFVFRPLDSSDLANAIRRFFGSQLFAELESRRVQIKEYANERYSWDKVAAITKMVYSDLLRGTEGKGQRSERRGHAGGRRN